MVRQIFEGREDPEIKTGAQYAPPSIKTVFSKFYAVAAFTWLSDQDRGARFPHTLRAVPLVGNGDAAFAWRDWK